MLRTTSRMVAAIGTAVAVTLTGALLPSSAHAATQVSYYVDPTAGNDANDGLSVDTAFKTIEHARDAVRAANDAMTGDIHVYLRGGTYNQTSTLKFTDADSGSNGHDVIYSAYNGEQPRLSGGMQITGWQLHDATKGIFRAPVPAGTDTRQLYVNGERQTRARSAAGPVGMTFINDKPADYQLGTGYTATGRVTVAGITAPLDQWGNQGNIEFIYNKVFTAPRALVESVTFDGTSTKVTMKNPGWAFVTNRGGTSLAGDMPWYVENAYELLDSPGEWYLDKSANYLYYLPKANQNLATSQVIAPRLEELLRVEGADADHKAQHIQFDGITFEYAGWLRPNTMGHTDAQNNVIREGNIPPKNIVGEGEQLVGAAVEIRHANSIRFHRNVFQHGGANGLNMYAGSQDNSVVGNRFVDFSAAGIAVGDYLGYSMTASENYAATTDARLMLRGNSVTNNYVGTFGLEYFSSSGISATFPRDMVISHNEVSGSPYTGIHVGWGWGKYPGIVSNTTISNNYIHELNTKLNDGGAIYTNGATGATAAAPATRITGNYLQNVGGSVGYAMYNDEANFLVTAHHWDQNVVNNASKWAFQWRNKGNVYANTYTNVSASAIDGSQTVTGTVFVSGQNWPAAAQEIMANAGLESAYADVKPVAAPAEQRFAEHFDEQLLGAAPAGWAISGATDATIQVTDSPSNTDRSLRVNKTSVSTNQYAVAGQSFTPIVSGSYSVRAKASQTNAIAWAVLLKSGQSIPIEVRFGASGQIEYNAGGGFFRAIQGYTANTWYDFAVTFNVQTRKYDLTINGVAKLTGATMNGAPAAIDSFALWIFRGSIGSANFDNITVTDGPLRLADSFEQATVGAAAPGWISNEVGGTATVISQPTPESKALELRKTVSAGVLIVTHDLGALSKGSVQMRVFAGQRTAIAQPIVLQGNGTNIEFAMFKDGNISYKNTSAAWSAVQPYAANTWYTLRVDFDTATDTFDLWVNGTKVVTGAPFASGGGSVTQLKQYIYSGSVGTMRTDDVSVTVG